MAPRQDNNQHGHSQPVGIENGQTFLADEYVRHAAEAGSHKQQPQQHTALKAAQDVLADRETRVIEFF